MDTVSFGRTGLKVSRLCFGTMTIGSSDWKPWVLDEDKARPLLSKCLDLGITFFDTANWYSTGESERVLGNVLLKMQPRDRLVIATKAYYPMSEDPNDRGLSRKHLLSSIDSSLSRLGTDYVALFVIHAFDTGTPVEETMEALHDIQKAGKVRYLGASTMYAWQFEKMNHIARINRWTPFINMQCQYNLLYREEEREIIPYCLDQGIAVTAFSPLARGWLSASNNVRAATDWAYQTFHGDALDLEIIQVVERIANELNVSMAEVALAWLYSRDAVDCSIIGASSAEQIEKNVKALDLELGAQHLDTLDNMYRPRDVINDYVLEPKPRYLKEV